MYNWDTLMRESLDTCKGTHPRIWKQLEKFKDAPFPLRPPNKDRESYNDHLQLWHLDRDFWKEVRNEMESQFHRMSLQVAVPKKWRGEALDGVVMMFTEEYREASEMDFARMLEEVEGNRFVERHIFIHEHEANFGVETAKKRVEEQRRSPQKPAVSNVVPVFASSSDHQKALEHPETKTKVKRRPVIPEQRNELPGALTAAQEVEASSPESEVIPVSSKSLKTFTNVFGSLEIPRGTVCWDDFVTAMRDARFDASHKGGSIVDFENTVKHRSITMHRPHYPSKHLEPGDLCWTAGHLNRKFGWDLDTFVERKKA